MKCKVKGCKNLRGKHGAWGMCQRHYGRAYYAKYPERRRAAVQRYRKRHPDRVKATSRKVNIKCNFGLEYDEYLALYEIQQGLCAICGVPETALTRRLHIDHNHKTGQIRALLCHACNTGLGAFKEDISLLRQAQKYLIALA